MACVTPVVTASFTAAATVCCTAEATASFKLSAKPSKRLSSRLIWSARFFRGRLMVFVVMVGSLQIEVEAVQSVGT
jgi:hypothetical protein